MSLALFRERIEAGEVDETVRQHLRGCDECRAYYDQLVLTKRALGDEGAAEEKARLMQALPLPRRGEGRGEGRRALIAVAAAVVIVIAGFLLLKKPGTDEVTMRGTNNPEAPAPFAVLVYGKDAPGQPVRLIADFPGSKEATVRMRAELQYFVRPGAKSIVVESRGADGKLLSAKSVPATDDLTAVGKAFPVGSFGPGSVEVCAALVTGEQQTIDDAVRAGATKYCSTLLVQP